MNYIQIAAGALILLGVAMLVMGYKIAGGVAINPPVITGIGFIVIASVFFTL